MINSKVYFVRNQCTNNMWFNELSEQNEILFLNSISLNVLHKIVDLNFNFNFMKCKINFDEFLSSSFYNK